MTSDYVLAAAKGLQPIFKNAMSKRIMKFKDTRLFNFKNSSEWNEIFMSTEGMDAAKELAENETPPVGTLREGYSVNISPIRFGKGIEFTEDDYEKAKDSTTKVDEILKEKRNQCLISNYKFFLDKIFYAYNNAFNSSATLLAPDGVELCGTHVWKSGETFINKGTKRISTSAIDDLMEYGGAFTDADGREMPITFDTIVVKRGSENAREAKKLFAKGIQPTQVGNVNIYEGEFTIIETPMISATNKNAWFAYDSMFEIPMPLYVGVHKMPVFNDPIKQNNEAVRMNVTGYMKVGINNLPINFYGSDGSVSGS